MVSRDDRQAVAGLLLRLREAGVTDHRLLSAFEKVPRRHFVPVIYLDEAYDRGHLPIECGQTMTSVDQVGRALLALDVPAEAKVLELGTGTGYQTALLAELGTSVVSLERYRTLVEKASIRLDNLGFDNVQLVHADGSNGYGDGGMFDRIIANCAFETVPKGFVEQLTSGGIVVAPIGPPDARQMMTKLTKTGSRFDITPLFAVRGQPFRPGLASAI